MPACSEEGARRSSRKEGGRSEVEEEDGLRVNALEKMVVPVALAVDGEHGVRLNAGPAKGGQGSVGGDEEARVVAGGDHGELAFQGRTGGCHMGVRDERETRGAG